MSLNCRLYTDLKIHDLEWPFCVKFCFTLVYLELRSLAFEAWLLYSLKLVVNVVGELQTEKKTATATRGFLATARLSCNTLIHSYNI